MKWTFTFLIASGLVMTGLPAAQAGGEKDISNKKKIQEQLNKLETQIEDLQSQAAELDDQHKTSAVQKTLNSAQSTLKEQWQNVSNASQSAWDSVASGTQTAIEETRQTYRQARQNIKEWQAEERLEDLRNRKNDLARELRGENPQISAYYAANQMTLDRRIHTAEEQIGNLKNTAMENWSDAHSQTQEALDQAEMAFQYAQLRVYKRQAEMKVQEFEDKINQLKSASAIQDTETRQEYKSALEDLNESMQTAREKVEDLSVDGNKDPKSFKKELDRALNQMRESYQEVEDYVSL